MELNKIYNENCLLTMGNMPDGFVDLVVTSPPYWGKRKYSVPSTIWNEDKDCEHIWTRNNTCDNCNAWRGQLGLEPTPEEFIAHLLLIFQEIYRVLKPSGTCWVNLADSYMRKKSDSNTAIHCGSLCMIPERFAIGMTDNGWLLRNVVIWNKPNVMPVSEKNCFTIATEYVYFFSKTTEYYFKQPMDMSIKHRNIWDIPNKPNPISHSAMYPERLVEIPILLGCPENGIVLDPFLGSGTTAVVAKKLNRQWLGIEMSEEYYKIAEERIGKQYGTE